jgi:hypothetical protein
VKALVADRAPLGIKHLLLQSRRRSRTGWQFAPRFGGTEYQFGAAAISLAPAATGIDQQHHYSRQK